MRLWLAIAFTVAAALACGRPAKPTAYVQPLPASLRASASTVVAHAAAKRPPPASIFRCPSPASPVPAEVNSQPWPLLDQVAPFQQWDCVDGEVVGVVTAYTGGLGLISWGQNVGPLKDHAGRGSAQGQYYFTTDADSARAIYFDVEQPQGTIGQVLGVKDGAGVRFLRRSMKFSPTLPNEFALMKAAHLVKLTVNDGRGSAPGELHFIATDAELLDGTPSYPLDVDRLVNEFIDPFGDENSAPSQAYLHSVLTALERAKSSDAAFAQFSGTYPKETAHGGYRVTWRPRDERLQIVVYLRYANVYTRMIRNPSPQAGTIGCTPPGADCAPRFTPVSIIQGRVYAAEYAVWVEYAKDGTRTAGGVHPVQTRVVDMDKADGYLRVGPPAGHDGR